MHKQTCLLLFNAARLLRTSEFCSSFLVHNPSDSRLTFFTRYKYKFLKATTANIPAHILKDNRGSKLTIGSSGLLKVQHLIPVRLTPAQQQQMDPGTNQQQSRVSYIEFYVMPEEERDIDVFYKQWRPLRPKKLLYQYSSNFIVL